MSKEKATQYQYLSATGPVEFNFTNDYMFRAALQQSKEALHGLVCSVLSLNPEDVSKIKLLNPIRIGEALSDKELRMDILVLMNDNTTIDLEMQVKNYNDWPERSLSYLCREFDDLEHGENYSDVGYAYQVGFLDFTLFEDHPEFVGRYQMRNVKDNYTYTDKFNIVVVELNHTDLATVDDINSGIDNWVRLFKAKTWEDVIMIAKADTELESAAESMYLSNSDWLIRKQCREREDYRKYEEGLKRRIKESDEKVSQLTSENSQLTSEVSNLTSENSLLRVLLKEHGIDPDEAISNATEESGAQ